LINPGLDKARALHFKSVIVLGHAHYYPKFGFVPADKWQIKAPFDVPTPVFMGIELVENGLDNVSGTVEYPPAFAMV
jgi:putative acetyltransferase